MKRIGIALASLAILCFYCCSTPTYTQPSESPDAILCFGQGGGYSGMVTEYALLSNGQLFKKADRKSDYEILKRVDKDLAKQAFSNYQHLGLGDLKLNSPGNLYYFIRYENKEEGNEIVWGGKAGVKEEVKLFYKILNRLVKDKKKES